MEDIIAIQKFKEGYNCAQSIFFHYAKQVGVAEEMAIKIATGFGAGMGRKQEVCGAISGGILTINSLYGREMHEEKIKQEIAYGKVRRMIDLFAQDKGTIYCKQLLDECDLQTEEGQKRFKDEQLIQRCYQCIGKVVEILDDVILENEHKNDKPSIKIREIVR